eukprot:GHVU01116187.1.p1 GENE.GHVU01116187.1~~GHVU01116187.1.p1  ORF type:complete len:263 (-),score=0.50 GHVU01116187.1:8-796(-)
MECQALGGSGQVSFSGSGPGRCIIIVSGGDGGSSSSSMCLSYGTYNNLAEIRTNSCPSYPRQSARECVCDAASTDIHALMGGGGAWVGATSASKDGSTSRLSLLGYLLYMCPSVMIVVLLSRSLCINLVVAYSGLHVRSFFSWLLRWFVAPPSSPPQFHRLFMHAGRVSCRSRTSNQGNGLTHSVANSLTSEASGRVAHSSRPTKFVDACGPSCCSLVVGAMPSNNDRSETFMGAHFTPRVHNHDSSSAARLAEASDECCTC